jgi:hypothetical protein
MTADPSGAVVMSDRFQIEPDHPLPELDCGTMKAFAATELRDAKRGLYALLPDPALPFRVDVINSIRRIDNNSLVRLLAWDVIDWPSERRRRPAIVFDRPHGPRLFSAPDARIEPFREEPLIRRVILPLCQVLDDFAFLSLVHRNIRAENLYLDGNDPVRSPIMLGECASAPPGYLQPVVYETIECGMAHPAGRGEGSAANDFYALGVTMAILIAGRNPLAGLGDREVIEQKLAKGSYAALVNALRIPTGMIEVFRGLLNDDENDRWGLEQLRAWLDGRRASPKQQVRPNKASRPLEVGGRQYVAARGVAEALSRNWDEGLELVRSGELDHWLRRGLSDEDRTEAVNTAKTTASEENVVDDMTLTRVCIALDPIGLIRIKDFRAMIDGAPRLASVGFADEAMRDAFAAMLRHNLAAFCAALTSRLRPELYKLAAAYERFNPTILREEIGFGIERAIYALNPNAPCRSPLFEADYVADLSLLVPALERLARTKGTAFDVIIDRHIAAFAGTRLKVNIVPELRELRDAKDRFGYALPAARILALIQTQTACEPAPALCGMIATMLEPALARYRNAVRRDSIRERMQDVAKSGRLDQLIAVVDDRAMLGLDEREFQAAAVEYGTAARGIERLDYERTNRAAISRRISSQVASLLSGAVSTLAVLVTILVKLV